MTNVDSEFVHNSAGFWFSLHRCSYLGFNELMALSAVAGRRSMECSAMLLGLITTINELRSHIRLKDSEKTRASATILGLPPERFVQLQQSIEHIFTHRIKIFDEKGDPDVWRVIEGLKFTNPTISLKISSADITASSKDKGLVWILQCLQQRCLSENMNWLITDTEHMDHCYEPSAFLRDEKYSDAMMVCFNALERGQPTLLSQINTCLYAHDQCEAFIDNIKRSESHPNLPLIEDVLGDRHEKVTVKRRQTIHFSKSRSEGGRVRASKKVSRSLPNIALRDVYHALRRKPPDDVDSKTLRPSSIPKVPSFNYSDNSVPKPTISILNCEDIKIYTESSSSSSAQSQGCWKLHDESLPKRESSRSDLFGFAALTGSPRTLLNEFIPQYGEKIDRISANKTVGNVLNELPSRPIPGQSLTSFLKTVSFSRTNTELDRENAHFSLSEALIATFEQLKWNEGESMSGRRTVRKRPSTSNFWSSYPGTPQFHNGGPSKASDDLLTNVSPSSVSTVVSSLSSGSGSSSSGGELSSRYIERIHKSNLARHLPTDDDELEALEASECDEVKAFSAEGVALSLLSKFNEKQLPTACDLLWLVSEQDAPQQILPIPPDGQIVNPDDYNGLNTIIRGTREWAPPRPQIIFTYNSPLPE